MMRYGLRAWGITGIAVAAVAAWQSGAWGVPLDQDGDLKLGVRTYVNARIQTENTDRTSFYAPLDPTAPLENTAVPGGPAANPPVQTLKSDTFPYSPAGHLRQNRFFVKAELDHDLDRLVDKLGPLPLLSDLPVKVTGLKYHLIYQGEAEGVYNWGPKEFSSSDSYQQLVEGNPQWVNLHGAPNGSNVVLQNHPPQSCTLETCPDIPFARSNLRHEATVENRLFQAYVEASVNEDLFLRFGRQVLVWGETDAFRLMDNINPIDSSFGGFLISLDERRVPLDMLRASYRIGEYEDLISEAQLEGFFSWDNKVSYYPGTPAGSPWTLPNLGEPSGTTYTYVFRPTYGFQSGRGGARLSFVTPDLLEMQWSLAYYTTYDDLPYLKVCVAPNFPLQRITTAAGGSGQIAGCPVGPTNLPISQPSGANPNNFAILAPQAFAVEQPAKTQIAGITDTFNIPNTVTRTAGISGDVIVRSEFAFIKGQPYYRQSTSDPFIFHSFGNAVDVSGNDRRDTLNMVMGLDTNQFIHWLNPVNSFFITTQFFYKHIIDPAVDGVLPVPAADIAPQNNRALGPVEPNFVVNYANQYLQTLLISTSYMSGQVNPSTTFFYDWSGSFVWIPSVTFVRDPFRFTVEYNLLTAGSLKGNSGTSLLRDRDNILFQFEYVI